MERNILGKFTLIYSKFLYQKNFENYMKKENEIMDIVKAGSRHASVKSRNASIAGADFVIECRVKEGAEMLQKLQALDGINGVSLLAHDGEVNF